MRQPEGVAMDDVGAYILTDTGKKKGRGKRETETECLKI